MAEILTDTTNDRLTETFIDATLTPVADETFASGVTANNKINASYDEVRDHTLRNAVVFEASREVMRLSSDIDFVAPVPTGAIGWAYAIVRQTGRSDLLVLNLAKQENEKRKFETTVFSELQIASLIDKASQEDRRPRGIVVDDVTSDGGTNEAMADFLVDQGFEITLVMSLLYRGEINRLKMADRKYPRAYLMAKHVPLSLDWVKRNESGLLTANKN